MNLDIRLPIGLMFTFFGLLLGIYGLATNGEVPDLYAVSLGINVNVVWGLFLFAFGALFLFLARRERKAGSGGDGK